MKGKTLKLVALVLLTLALGGAALAQDYGHKVRADIPFRFYAGGKVMPAGTYLFTINVETHNVAMLQSNMGNGAFLSGSAYDGSKDGRALLTFRTNKEDVYVLEKVQWPEYGISFDIRKELSSVAQDRVVNATETVIAQLGR